MAAQGALGRLPIRNELRWKAPGLQLPCLLLLPPQGCPDTAWGCQKAHGLRARCFSASSLFLLVQMCVEFPRGKIWKGLLIALFQAPEEKLNLSVNSAWPRVLAGQRSQVALLALGSLGINRLVPEDYEMCPWKREGDSGREEGQTEGQKEGNKTITLFSIYSLETASSPHLSWTRENTTIYVILVSVRVSSLGYWEDTLTFFLKFLWK